MPNSKIASYMNLKGTTLTSFRMGKNGVELRSAALLNGKDEVSGLFYKTADEDDAIRKEKAEFEKMQITYPEYDLAIPSRNIKRMYATKSKNPTSKDSEYDTLTLILQDGTELILRQTISAEKLNLPDDADDGEVAVYSVENDEVKMGRSRMTITENIDEEGEDDALKIPTVAAIKSHITGVTEMLNSRLQGNKVSK